MGREVRGRRGSEEEEEGASAAPPHLEERGEREREREGR
jgi:hypothetical protein